MRLLILALLLPACKGAPYEGPWCGLDPSTPSPSGATVTWHADIAPIFAAKCGACHVEGGHAPFAVDRYEAVAPWAASIRTDVAGRVMPPWLAADCCAEWYDDYSLTDEEIAAVLAWVDQGAPEGDPSTAAPLPAAIGGLSRVDLTLTMPEPYTPAPPEGSVDDTRCFVLEWPESETRYVTGLRPQPSNRAIVHHLAVGVMPESGVRELEAADESDPGVGFACSGGLVGLPGIVPIGGGLVGGDYPRGIGTEAPAGSRVVLEVHYSLADGPAGADQTSLELRLDDNATVQSSIVITQPGWLAGKGMLIPAGEADVTWYYRFRPSLFTGGVDVDVQGITPHMHRYATRMRVLAIHADETSDCLLEIPRWAFGWEQPYWLAEPLRLRADDDVYLECHFDNSAANQPDGAAPRDIAWGDQDQDMCAAFLGITPVDG